MNGRTVAFFLGLRVGLRLPACGHWIRHSSWNCLIVVGADRKLLQSPRRDGLLKRYKAIDVPIAVALLCFGLPRIQMVTKAANGTPCRQIQKQN